MKKYFALMLSIILVLACSFQVSASERSSGALGTCYITVSGTTSGIRVTFETNATASADKIGCKDIVLQEKVNGVWKAINIAEGYATGTSTYSGSAVYTSAVAGRTYRAYCTHYATWGSTTKTLSNSSGELVYN